MKPTIQIDIIKPTRVQRIAAALAVLAVFAFGGAPICKAVTPAPDGGYANGNTAEGTSALFSLSSGTNNTALGYQALFSDAGGSGNTAIGWDALRFNTSGTDNAATGAQALYKNTTGAGNTAVGRNALLLNTTSSSNTAVGFNALLYNSTGGFNTAVGAGALTSNTASQNTALGYEALVNSTTGLSNTAVGYQALFSNYPGGNNVAVGYMALQANVSGNDNTAIGNQAGASLTAGSGNVCIGAGVFGDPGADNGTWIRNIYPSIVAGRAVYVDESNRIGTLSSSRRYKDEIKPMDQASETLYALKPVTFRYKKEVDRSRALSFGLIAEEVAEISPDLITRDEEGRPQTVRYDAVNGMLLNEFLKEHRKVEQQRREMQEQKVVIAELRSTIAQHENGMQALVARLQEQEERLVKVSARLELRESTPQLVEHVGNP